MTGVLVTAAVAPLLASPSLRSEQVSQMVLGEGAEVLERNGRLLRVQTLLDRYEGWLAAGYAVEVTLTDAEAWIADAAWSEGAIILSSGGIAVRVPRCGTQIGRAHV